MIPIHVGTGTKGTYLLQEESPGQYTWYLNDQPTEAKGTSVPLAIREARRLFRHDNFQTLLCGTRFFLPDRDEHGENALFSEMVRSLASGNGQYFDPAYGQNAIVREIPIKSRDLAVTMNLLPISSPKTS